MLHQFTLVFRCECPFALVEKCHVRLATSLQSVKSCLVLALAINLSRNKTTCTSKTLKVVLWVSCQRSANTHLLAHHGPEAVEMVQTKKKWRGSFDDYLPDFHVLRMNGLGTRCKDVRRFGSNTWNGSLAGWKRNIKHAGWKKNIKHAG